MKIKLLRLFIKNNKVIGSIGIEKYDILDNLIALGFLKGREIDFVLLKDYWKMV